MLLGEIRAGNVWLARDNLLGTTTLAEL